MDSFSMSEFSILDLSNREYKQNKSVAISRYQSGEEPIYAVGVNGKTAGYGRVDDLGYFEYPLPMENGKIAVETIERNLDETI